MEYKDSLLFHTKLQVVCSFLLFLYFFLQNAVSIVHLYKSFFERVNRRRRLSRENVIQVQQKRRESMVKFFKTVYLKAVTIFACLLASLVRLILLLDWKEDLQWPFGKIFEYNTREILEKLSQTLILSSVLFLVIIWYKLLYKIKKPNQIDSVSTLKTAFSSIAILLSIRILAIANNTGIMPYFADVIFIIYVICTTLIGYYCAKSLEKYTKFLENTPKLVLRKIASQIIVAPSNIAQRHKSSRVLPDTSFCNPTILEEFDPSFKGTIAVRRVSDECKQENPSQFDRNSQYLDSSNEHPSRLTKSSSVPTFNAVVCKYESKESDSQGTPCVLKERSPRNAERNAHEYASGAIMREIEETKSLSTPQPTRLDRPLSKSSELHVVTRDPRLSSSTDRSTRSIRDYSANISEDPTPTSSKISSSAFSPRWGTNHESTIDEYGKSSVIRKLSHTKNTEATSNSTPEALGKNFSPIAKSNTITNFSGKFNRMYSTPSQLSVPHKRTKSLDSRVDCVYRKHTPQEVVQKINFVLKNLVLIAVVIVSSAIWKSFSHFSNTEEVIYSWVVIGCEVATLFCICFATKSNRIQNSVSPERLDNSMHRTT